MPLSCPLGGAWGWRWASGSRLHRSSWRSSSGRALIRCFTWMNPTSPLAMNRCWRLRGASLPCDSRRGLLTLKVFMHVSSRVRLSSEISRDDPPGEVLRVRVPWVWPVPGIVAIILAALTAWRSLIAVNADDCAVNPWLPPVKSRSLGPWLRASSGLSHRSARSSTLV